MDEDVAETHTDHALSAHALGHIERAAHLLMMLTAGGVRVTRPAELTRLLGILATTLGRQGPHQRGSDYETAATTLAALETAQLIIIEPARRKRAQAILGSALAIRC